MKKLLTTLSIISLCTFTSAFAGGIAIKLEVTENADDLINTKIRKAAGMEEMEKKRHHHVTIGFIDNKNGLNNDQLKDLGNSIVNNLKKSLSTTEDDSVIFTVKSVGRLFGREEVGFIPDEDSTKELKDVNKIVNQVVEKLGYKCNDNTKVGSYTPHMSFYLSPKDDAPLKKAFENLKSTHNSKELFFKLFNVSYSIVK